MRKAAWIPAGVLLALGASCLARAHARDDEEKRTIASAQRAAEDVRQLADLVDHPAEFKKLAEAVSTENDHLLPIMWQMKPVDKGGMQIGKPGTFPADSIELELLRLQKKPPTAVRLAAQAGDLQRMAGVICAIAEVTPHYGPQYTEHPSALKRWNSMSGSMSEWGHELLAVVKAKDAKNLPKVVMELNQSCWDCHQRFRDESPREAVEAAADAVNNPAQLKERADGLFRMYALDELSVMFKPRDKGGLGVGPKANAILPDGIEGQLWALEMAPPAAAQLASQKMELQRMAEVVRAIAEATPHYGKEYATTDASAKAWAGFSDDMKQGSDALRAAVKGNDVLAFRKSLGKLNQSCDDCHAKFRGAK